jgi:UDP-N-acetylmuramate dehydrogenase
MRLIEGGDLRPLNSFGVPARARYLARLDAVEDLPTLLELRERQQLPILVVGGGSNILFRRDFEGIVASIRIHGIQILDSGGERVLVSAAAGVSWDQLVQYTLDAGLSGLENLSLIPGTVGAAPIQNIGAYGVELSERLQSLQTVSLETGDTRTFALEDCKFGYRDSVFKSGPQTHQLITSVTLALHRERRPVLDYDRVAATLTSMGVTHPQPRDVSRAVSELRRRKLPDPARLGNAGSFFKNPVVDAQTRRQLQTRHGNLPSWPVGEKTFKLSAARLIELCGWKGCRRGDAGVYHQHALILVNHGRARGEQIWALAKDIRSSVEDRFGITLETEALIV